MRIKIKITKEVLRESMYCPTGYDGVCNNEDDFKNKRGIGFNCAIGKAIGKIFPFAWVGKYDISLFDSYAEFFTGKTSFQIDLPIEATEFINIFDKTNPIGRVEMPEISFEIDVPDVVIDQIGISEAERIISNSLTMEKV